MGGGIIRKKVITEPALTSWADVDNTMKLIGELQGSLCDLEVEMNRQLAAVKEKTDKQAQPLHTKIKVLEKDIKEYVDRHRSEIEGKTKKLNFGSTGYRLSSKVVIPKTILKEDFIATLKRQGLTDCIKTEESVLRDVLKTHPREVVLGTGASLQSKDEFWYEIDKERLQPK